MREEEEGRVLEFRDFHWRVGRVVAERSAWSRATEISAPALTGGRPWFDAGDLSLFVLLYESDVAEGGRRKARAPHAALGLRPDGDVAFFEDLPREPDAKPIGFRYGDSLSLAKPHERAALEETFYVTLTEPHGPLWNPWLRIAQERRHDVGALFRACVGPALVPYYRKYAKEFLTLVGLPGE